MARAGRHDLGQARREHWPDDLLKIAAGGDEAAAERIRDQWPEPELERTLLLLLSAVTSPQMRQALVLFYRDGRSAQEIGAGTGKKTEAAGQLLHQARKRLRRASPKLVEYLLEGYDSIRGRFTVRAGCDLDEEELASALRTELYDPDWPWALMRDLRSESGGDDMDGMTKAHLEQYLAGLIRHTCGNAQARVIYRWYRDTPAYLRQIDGPPRAVESTLRLLQNSRRRGGGEAEPRSREDWPWNLLLATLGCAESELDRLFPAREQVRLASELQTLISSLLTPVQGETVLLRFRDGLSLKQIAARRGRSQTGCHMALNRGMDILAERLGQGKLALGDRYPVLAAGLARMRTGRGGTPGGLPAGLAGISVQDLPPPFRMNRALIQHGVRTAADLVLFLRGEWKGGALPAGVGRGFLRSAYQSLGNAGVLEDCRQHGAAVPEPEETYQLLSQRRHAQRVDPDARLDWPLNFLELVLDPESFAGLLGIPETVRGNLPLLLRRSVSHRAQQCIYLRYRYALSWADTAACLGLAPSAPYEAVRRAIQTLKLDGGLTGPLSAEGRDRARLMRTEGMDALWEFDLLRALYPEHELNLSALFQDGPLDSLEESIDILLRALLTQEQAQAIEIRYKYSLPASAAVRLLSAQKERCESILAEGMNLLRHNSCTWPFLRKGWRQSLQEAGESVSREAAIAFVRSQARRTPWYCVMLGSLMRENPAILESQISPERLDSAEETVVDWAHSILPERTAKLLLLVYQNGYTVEMAASACGLHQAETRVLAVRGRADLKSAFPSLWAVLAPDAAADAPGSDWARRFLNSLVPEGTDCPPGQRQETVMYLLDRFLTARQRDLVLLTYRDKLPKERVADRLGYRSASSVATILSQARSRLRSNQQALACARVGLHAYRASLPEDAEEPVSHRERVLTSAGKGKGASSPAPWYHAFIGHILASDPNWDGKKAPSDPDEATALYVLTNFLTKDQCQCILTVYRDGKSSVDTAKALGLPGPRSVSATIGHARRSILQNPEAMRCLREGESLYRAGLDRTDTPQSDPAWALRFVQAAMGCSEAVVQRRTRRMDMSDIENAILLQMSDLPAAAQRMLLLHYMEGVDPAEAAKREGLGPDAFDRYNAAAMEALFGKSKRRYVNPSVLAVKRKLARYRPEPKTE